MENIVDVELFSAGPRSECVRPLAASLSKIGEIYKSKTEFPDSAYRIDNQIYQRFMNNILVPIDKYNLSTAEIANLNTARNELISNSSHKVYNRFVRSAFSLAISACDANSFLEIGPGRSPNILRKSGDYSCYDIDPAVSSYCQSLGYNSLLTDEFEAIADRTVDAVYASFVFQFSVSEQMISSISRVISKTGRVMFNTHGCDASRIEFLCRKFSSLGFQAGYYDIGSWFGKNDLAIVFRRS